VITLHLDAASLARVRLAVSPALEAVEWLRLAANGRRHPVFGDPGAAARFALRDPDVALLGQLLTTKSHYMPDLFTPKPLAGKPQQAWDGQLEEMRETPTEIVFEQLREVEEHAGTAEPWQREALDAGERGTFAGRAARGFSAFWRHAIADEWSALHDRIQVDLTMRAQIMATGGVGALFGSLHPIVSWTGSFLRLAKPYSDELHYVDQELVLAPIAMGWPKVYTQLWDRDAEVLYYPAAGVGAAPANPDADALARLLGGTRAALLRDLDVPRTTSELAGRHGLAPATVSYHLRVLLDASLVTRERDGRLVRYRRSGHGDALRGAEVADAADG